MRGVVFTGGRELEMMDFPDPTPGPDEVVVEMKASGMCGSDLHQYRRPKGQTRQATGFPQNPDPVIAGHEPCGVVAAVGPGVLEKEAKVGQRYQRVRWHLQVFRVATMRVAAVDLHRHFLA